MTEPFHSVRLGMAIPGKPGLWRRTKSDGKRRIPNEKTEAWEKTVAWHAIERFRGSQIRGKVVLSVRFFFSVPTSDSGRRAWLKSNGLESVPFEFPHSIVPDLDNCLKAIKDGLTKSAIWRDDCQVFRVYAEKWWCDVPGRQRTEIEVAEFDAIAWLNARKS